jgi:hypothetical protein
LAASLLLAGFLFADHVTELPRAWHWITTDMQQQQHLLIAVILFTASMAALAGIKFKQKWLGAALPVAFAAIGVVFLVHPQHGTDSEAARALLIHRVAGTSLIVAGVAFASTTFWSHWRKLSAIIAGILLVISAGLFISYREPLMTDNMSGSEMQSHHTYSLHLMEGMNYQPNQPTQLMFDIRDENNKVLKDFDITHEKQMHLIVVRKDRNYFQHVHPKFDKDSGMFAVTDFKFPTDGEYRVFADFTPSDVQMGADGMKLAVTPYKDVKVGTGQYTAQSLGADSLASNANGLNTNLSLSGDNTTPVAYAGVQQTVVVTITKNGAPFNNLEPYLGALGHMVVLGPDLEFIHAHPLSDATTNQNGTIMFAITFPDPGQYKMYLQTQADGQVNTTDYVFSVKANPGNNSNSNNSMQNMDHMEH